MSRIIHAGRQQLGLSIQQFATAIGVTRAAVQQWERPDGLGPNRRHQARVALLLSIPLADLVAGRGMAEPDTVQTARVPIVPTEVAADPSIIDNFLSSHKFEMVPVPVPVHRHTFAWRVLDDSMAANTGDCFTTGTMVVVEPEMTARPSDYVLTRSEQSLIAFRQLVKDGGTLYLYPLNRRYPVEPLGMAKVIGVIRALTRRFR